RICRDFARHGKCRCQNCRFSHHVNAPKNNQNEQATRVPGTKPALSVDEVDFRDWKRHVPAKPQRVGPLGSQLGPFFREARRLLDHDVGVFQEVIRALSTEGGLKRVHELIEGLRDAWPAPLKLSVFADRVQPFLSIITHPEALASLILEQAVGTIYTFLYGLSGTRAITLLGFLAGVLDAHKEMEQGAGSTVGHLETTLLVFWQIIELNSTAFANEALVPIAEAFKALVVECQESQAQSTLYNVQLHLERIMRRLKIGDALPTTISAPGKATDRLDRAPALFNINRNPPGGRHDNDSANICDIRILPTSQEILSPHAEYLPVKDPEQWHIAGVPGLLDRNFRLLREDTVGQLRDAIHAMLRPASDREGKSNQVRTYTYPNVTVANLAFSRHTGLQFVAQFRQPPQVQRMNERQREEWWQLSKRLQGGALVCLVDPSGDVLFCTAADPPRLKPGEERPKDLPSLCKNKDIATVACELIEPSDEEVQYILDRYRPRVTFPPVTLVEFPGIILPAFAPTLRALQHMSRSDNIPFSAFLAPVSPSDANPVVDVPPPAYAVKPGFSFDLSCLMNDQKYLQFQPGQALDIKTLQAHSTLDNAQAMAMVHTLQRSIGLIQGPPGTGKSFTGVALIKVLLANGAKEKADLGPIICVCYTNHALDQLLEDLLKQNVTNQIVRIGSRCKSELVEGYSLRKLVNAPSRTKAEKHSLWELSSDLKDCQDQFDNLRLQTEGLDANLQWFLRSYHIQHYAQLFGDDGDDGTYIPAQKAKRNVFQSWVKAGRKSKADPRPIETLFETQLEHMTAGERQRIYQHWLETNRAKLHDEVQSIVADQQKTKKRYDNVRNELDLRCLCEAQVIGVTTSGLARNLKMLKRLRSKVLLCEEAGEVLEAHILTALLPSVEHAILIGDHMQLRPQIQDYDLSRENHRGGEQYSLDKSLFERLVDPNDESSVQVPFSTLETQRRMHPSIARLIKDTLYPRLEDAPSVQDYPEVCGMRRRLFWLDHQHGEGNVSDADALGTSHWNGFEVEMTTALVTHLLRQGSYKDGDIAVLTPYLGQLHRLRQRLSQSVTIVVGDKDQDDLANAGLENDADKEKTPIAKTDALQTVRAATIDNFQGEEAKVVVISLVRSNTQRRCGFLRTSNRINVLLSRAKHGMYIIGNSATAGDVAMWRQVVDILKENDNFGARLELQCPRHLGLPIWVSQPDHFAQYSPEGGCNKRCVNRLRCGHACKQKCHSTLLHDAVYCQELCPRPQKGCKHICPKLCGDPCPQRCQVKVFEAGRTLKCGHAAERLLCWQAQDPSVVLCPVPVAKTVPGCNHLVTVPCHVDVSRSTFKCKTPCGKNRPCGHICKGLCCSCCIRDENSEVIMFSHGPCRQPCGRNYSTCTHICSKVCHPSEQCPPCGAPCNVQCGHSICPKKCCEPCAPCAEDKCLSCCPHSQCTLPCAAPCDNVPCSRRCEKVLECGHRCPSVCGEICPTKIFCQLCATPEVQEHVVDYILSQAYREIDLDKNPCIFPRCGHFLTMESMDGQMDMKRHYELDAEGRPAAIALSSEPFATDVKRCGTCRGSLRDVSRYGRLVRRALLDEATKKFIVYINSEYVPMAQELSKRLSEMRKVEAIPYCLVVGQNSTFRIENSREKQITLLAGVMKRTSPIRWRELIKLRDQMVRYYDRVKIEEQPFSRVQALVERAQQLKEGRGKFEFSESVLQTKGILLATALLIRLDNALLSDFISLYMKSKTSASKFTLIVNLQANREECRAFIGIATDLKRVLHQVEGYIFLAQLCALQRPYARGAEAENCRVDGQSAVASARDLCHQYPGQTNGLLKEVDGAEAMLKGSTFYTVVSNEERMAVVAAMAREFLGTGHWYYCANGHPFTIGECGGAVQESTCPECGAPVGGQGHVTVEGVTRADDLERGLEHLALRW
ncbi:P-loop containing nucleoside triphosphate hydrolase protein, partial [Aspergillus heteromorphus CBS 117.55]